MPRHCTFPFLFDEVMTLDISNLSKWGFLKANRTTSGTFEWKTRGETTARVSIEANTTFDTMKLSYVCDGEEIEYTVHLSRKDSNLGTGFYYYFICPFSNKRCRKLYFSGRYFVHREALQGMYSIQTDSHQMRAIKKTIGREFEIEEIYEEIYSKYFRTHYNGKRTKRYKKLLSRIHDLEGVIPHEY